MSGVINPVTYLVRKGYSLKYHIHCQVSNTPSHTLSDYENYRGVSLIFNIAISSFSNRKDYTVHIGSLLQMYYLQIVSF